MISINFVRRISKKTFKDKGLTNKALLNGFATLLDYGARMSISLFLNPILVEGLGDYLYGVWQLLSRTMTYVSAASGQPTQAIKILVANRQFSGDYAEKQRSVGSAIVAWLLFLPLSVVVGGLAIWIFPYALQTPGSLVQVVRITGLILIINLFFTSLVGLPKAVLLGENLGYKRMGWSVIFLAIGGGATALAIVMDTGIVGVAVAAVFTSLVTGAMYYWTLKTHVSWFGIKKPTRSEVKSFVSFSGWVLVWEFMSKLLLSGDVVFLGFIESPELVTSYTLTKYLTITVINLTMMIISSALPGLGGLVGVNQSEKVMSLREDLILFIWLLGGSASITILAWNRVFMSLWVGDDYFAGSIETMLIVIMALQLAFIRLDANVIDLTLNVKNKTVLSGISIGASLLFSWLLMHHFDMGIVGLCLGFILGRSLLSFYYPRLIAGFMRIEMKRNPSFYRLIVLLIFLFGLIIVFYDYLKVNTWTGLIFGSVVTFVMICMLVFIGGISRYQRARILKQYVVRLLS